MAAVAAEYAGEVNFLGVAGRSDASSMQQFLADTGVGNLTHVNDEGGEIWSEFGVPTQPAFAFIDDDGSVETVITSFGEDGLRERAAALAAA